MVRIVQNKLNFSETSRKTTYFILSSIKYCIAAITALFAYVLNLLLAAKQHSGHQSESSESTFDETVGGPHFFTKNPEGLFGDEYSNPSHDPFSNWSSR